MNDKEYYLNLLKETDKKFCAEVSRYGAKAWAEYFCETGKMIGAEKIIEGKENIFNAMNPFFSSEGSSLTWEPEYSEISNSYDLGYTYGKFVRKYKDISGNIQTVTGRYTTIWRKQIDGSWKIELDTGTN